MDEDKNVDKGQLEKKKDKKTWDLISKILAFVLTVAYALVVANMFMPFIPAGAFLNFLNKFIFYAPMALIITVNFELFSDKNIIFRILIILVWAAIIIFSFFPNTISFLKS